MKNQVVRKADSTLAVQAPQIQSQKTGKKMILFCLCQIVLTVFAVLGTAICFVCALDILNYYKSDGEMFIYIVSAVAAFVFSLIFLARKFTKFLLPIASVAIIAAVVAMWKTLVKGAVLFYNFLSYTFWDFDGWVIPKADVPYKSIPKTEAITLFLAFVFVLIALYLAFAVVRRTSFWLTLIGTLIPVVFSLTYYLVAPPAFAFFMLVICWIALFSFRIGTTRKVKKEHFSMSGKRTFRVSSLDYAVKTQGQQIVSTLIISVVCFAVLLVAVPTSSYQQPDDVVQAGKDVYKYVNTNLLMDIKNFFGVTNEGNLTAVDDKIVTGKTTLKVKPQGEGVFDSTAYLRSYVGSVYTTRAWQPIEESEYEKYDLFDSVSPESYQPQYTDALYSGFLGSKNTDYTLSVKNVGANKRRIYAPYNSILSEDSWIDIANISLDGAANSTGLFGKSSYDMQIRASEFIVGKSVSYPSMKQTKLSRDDYVSGLKGIDLKYNQLSATNAAQKEYIQNEKEYREFVLNNYLDVPQSASEAVKNAVGALTVNDLISKKLLEDSGFSLADIKINELKSGKLHIETADGFNYVAEGSYSSDYINRTVTMVRNYLANNTQYTLTSGRSASNIDFVDYFLNYNLQGHSIHYATTATLMLRELGVPSRYVEGYVLNDPSATPSTDEDGNLIVTDASYHSWVEVYQPGQGWVPVDVTPGYYQDDMEFVLQNEDDIYIEEIEIPDDWPNYAPDESIIPDNNAEETFETTDFPYQYLWLFILIAIVVILIAAIVIIIVRRNNILKRRKQAFASKDNRLAVMAMYRFATELFAFDGLPLQIGQTNMDYAAELSGEYKLFTEEEFERFTEIALAAKFSEHEIDDNDSLYVKRFTNTLLSHVYSCTGKFRKLVMKYLKALI